VRSLPHLPLGEGTAGEQIGTAFRLQ